MKPSRFRVLLCVMAIVLAGCAAQYKLWPGYFTRYAEIHTIASYPLLYQADGKEQRLFGMTFDAVFYPLAVGIPMSAGVSLESPEELQAVCDLSGIAYCDSTYVSGLEPARFPSYSYPSAAFLDAISSHYDAVLVPILLQYNEVSAGEEIGQMCLTTFLTGGMITYSEKNSISMQFLLIDTETKEVLWDTTRNRSGEMGIQREGYSIGMAKDLTKYFPFSVTFKA